MKTIIAFAIATMALSGAASAQDARWAGWIGCWSPAQGSQSISAARVCVERAGQNGVTLRTTIEGQPALEQTIVADGAGHPVSDNECRGTQRAEWSRDGQRLYAKAELMCGNENPRSVSGLALIAADGSWLDIQSVRVDGRESTRVRRYRRITEGLASTTHFGAALTLSAIKEANGKVPPAVLEAAIVETHTTFPLTSREVIDLDQAGVSNRLIDVLIALSYPKKFVVERASAAPVLPPLTAFSDPFYYDPFYYGYGGYYYSPFAYTYGGSYYPYAFSPAYVVVDGNAGSGRPQSSGSGRVIDGVGYTRVTTREPVPAVRPDGSTAAASGSGGSGSSSSSGGSSVSSQGFSGGGGSSDGGRTAVPR
jgi:uncharacterized membrane protein YgcG